MGKHLNLDGLNDLFAQGKDFLLTDKMYEKRIGSTMPKTKSYLKNNSPLARKAFELGFEITDIQETPVIERTIYFKKK